jgi:hypothetical protein
MIGGQPVLIGMTQYDYGIAWARYITIICLKATNLLLPQALWKSVAQCVDMLTPSTDLHGVQICECWRAPARM